MRPTKSMLLIFCFTACIAHPAAAQNNTPWQDLELYGGQINRIAIDPFDSSYLYAGSWNGDGFFKSTDSGETWLISSEDDGWFRNLEVYDIDINPNDPQNIWVANNQYVDVSYDYGFTWKTFYFANEEGRFCYTVKVDPHDVTGDTVYVGTGGPNGTDELGVIYKTIDGGETWFKMENTFPPDYQPFNIWDIDVNPAVPDEIWATSRKAGLSPEGRIFMTMDSGNQWWSWNAAQWFDGASYYFSFLDEILIHPQNPYLIFSADGYGILRKQDGTNTTTGWSWVTDRGGSRALCIAPAYPYSLYAGFVDIIGKITDDGTSWTYYDRPGEFLSLAANPDNPDILFGGDVNQGVFKSSDGAQTWQPKNNGIRANSVFATDVSPVSADTLVAGTLAGVYRQAAGAPWTRINDSNSHAVIFHPIKQDTIFAGFDWEIGRSTDKGSTWTYTDISDKKDAHRAVSITVAKSNPDIICAGVSFLSGKRGEVIKSTDGGTTYSMVWETTVPVNTVKLHPADSQIVFAGTGSFYAPVAPGAIYKSTDGGKTLNPASSQQLVVNSLAISESNPDFIYIGCGASNYSYAGIYKSTDGGMTWEEKITGLPIDDNGKPHFAATDIQIDPGNSSIVYAALMRHGIYVSMDGGEYWTRIGLSDYKTYDVNIRQPAAPAPLMETIFQKSASQNLPSSTILAGTASGMYEYSTAGTGVLTGIITSQQTKASIDSADVSASCGSTCVSSEGYYLLLLPAGVHTIDIDAPGYERATVASITVPAGQSVSYDIVLTPRTDDGGDCVASSLLHGTPQQGDLDLLRTFRDRVLTKSRKGNELISFYYSCGKDVWKVLKAHPRLKKRCLQILNKAIPFIASSVSSKSVPMASSLLNDASLFLFDLEQVSPQNLKTKINKLRRDMKDDILLKLF